MSNSYEEISNNNANSSGRTDANLANDSLHLGGIKAEEYATKKYVRDYHDTRENVLKEYIDAQDNLKLTEAKEYANALVRNQDFTAFAMDTDVLALKQLLLDKIDFKSTEQKNYTDAKVGQVVTNTNANFNNVSENIIQLNRLYNELFQSVSSGKSTVAEAITGKGVQTSATATFQTMANNIKKITTESSGSSNSSGNSSSNSGNSGSNNTTIIETPYFVIPDGYIKTTDATARPEHILQGYTAYANGEKIHGTYVAQGSSGGSSSGSVSYSGVILGQDEVVVKKIYGAKGVLTGGRLVDDDGRLNPWLTNVVKCALSGNYIIASKQLTEGQNYSNEIVVYEITEQIIESSNSIQRIHHLRYVNSYTLSSLGISGELRCIAASPIGSRVSIGTTAGIYTFSFNGGFSSNSRVINKPCNNYNDIVYSNTNPYTFAYRSNGFIYIESSYVEIQADNFVFMDGLSVSGNSTGLFRFSHDDRYLLSAPWGTLGKAVVNIILLDKYKYVCHETIEEATQSGWGNGQIAINSTGNFMILNGKPHSLSYSLENKKIMYTKLSDTNIIPYDPSANESLYATFSSDNRFVYASSQDSNTGYWTDFGCYEVNFLNLNAQWSLVSAPLIVPRNSDGSALPVIDNINNRVMGFHAWNNNIIGVPATPKNENYGFYYYYPDPNEKTIIGLEYGGGEYYRHL